MRTLNPGPLKYIHVNQHIIRSNTKLNRDDPPLRIKTGNMNIAAAGIKVAGTITFMYSRKHPILKCGARLVAVTNGYVVVYARPIRKKPTPIPRKQAKLLK